MDLSCIIHDITFNTGEDELLCCDPQSGRISTAIAPAEIEVYVKEVPWYTTTLSEMMVRYKDREYEITLCEGCYESIICKLLKERKNGS
jgi:hypothetical protein